GGFPDLSSAAEAQTASSGRGGNGMGGPGDGRGEAADHPGGTGNGGIPGGAFGVGGAAYGAHHGDDAGPPGRPRGSPPVSGRTGPGGKRDFLRAAPGVGSLFGSGRHLVAGGFCSEGDPRGPGGYFPRTDRAARAGGRGHRG